MNYKQLYAIKEKDRNRIKEVYPFINNEAGIYILTRRENGFKYAYVGQAKHLLERLVSHLMGYQHIDISLKKHGLISETNKSGWDIITANFKEEELDEKEQYFIKTYSNEGFQLYNHTTGSQGKGKEGLKETVKKGYQQGVAYGYSKAQKEVTNYFEKHLNVSVKKEGNKNQEKALEKFKNFIDKEW